MGLVLLVSRSIFMLINWDYIYTTLGIKDFIYFISSPSIQETLFPVKLVFILFTAFFFCAVVWFYFNSSYIQYRSSSLAGIFSKDNQKLKKAARSWSKIKKRMESGSESDLKLAIIEADDLLFEHLQDLGYEGTTFEELLAVAGQKKLPDFQEVSDAHRVRNAIVFEPGFKLESQKAKEVLAAYEKAIKKLAA